MATGSENHHFGHPEWEAVTLGLKDLDDATKMRAHILLALERAERGAGGTDEASLLTFVVIGGGPTGVELAGIVAELGKRALASDFRRIRGKSLRVILLEGSDRLLGGFPDHVSDYARRALEQLGVEVRTETLVSDITENQVHIGEEVISAATVMWCAGVRPTPVAAWLDCAHEGGTCGRRRLSLRTEFRRHHGDR